MARPLMTMSAAMAFWRAASSGTPFQLLAESPEISMTRRKPLIELLSISRWAKVIAEPMALRPKALRGCDISLSANPAAAAAPSMMVQGTTDRKRVVSGKRVSVRLDHGGRHILDKKTKKKT